MKYIIYGINRVSKDFIYIFNNLEILYFVDSDYDSDYFLGYCVKSMESMLADTLSDQKQIILCDIDKSVKEKKLQERGFIYGRDYLYEEDFFTQLDDLKIPCDRKIAVWGTGNMCRFLLKHNFPWKADIFIDTYKKQERFQGRPVYAPSEILDLRKYYVIIAVEKDEEIRGYLSENGLGENTDFFRYKTILELPSVLLRQTIFDRSYYDLECNTMQNHLEILSDGNTRCCCTTFVSQGLDNIFDKNQNELWHSIIHKILCLSTENKTFSYCDKSMCPLFVAKKPQDSQNIQIENKPYKSINPFPETLALGYDSSCNLACITCRKDLHFAKGRELEMVKRIENEVITQYLPHCKFLILAGSGEVFASPSYRKIYEANECNPKYIRLLSNGTLFTSSNWEHFRRMNHGKIMLTVSVDAASKETYRRIRGGNFDVLRENMKFASELRHNGQLSYFRMNFVVQKENYNEMIDFVQWGKALNVDEVFFTKILNWGTYTSEEFEQVSMMEKDGITPKPELREVLNHPVMQSDIVDLGTIQFGHKVDEVGIVENYYMWELEKRGGKLFV